MSKRLTGKMTTPVPLVVVLGMFMFTSAWRCQAFLPELIGTCTARQAANVAVVADGKPLLPGYPLILRAHHRQGRNTGEVTIVAEKGIRTAADLIIPAYGISAGCTTAIM